MKAPITLIAALRYVEMGKDFNWIAMMVIILMEMDVRVGVRWKVGLIVGVLGLVCVCIGWAMRLWWFLLIRGRIRM